LAAALKERGYADEAIAQIMGKNLFRLLSGQADK
jgi:microsomal dipeptidase-like Zn-dependent dipeptidase